ncbi:MAG: hypothetical protein HYX79_00030 [Chloroflexi bacterium]|nr:hypothetical protein [Chloroflexota bacterium]
MVRQSASNSTLRTMGAATAAFSLALALLVLFVIPGNSYFSGMALLILGFTFICGLFGFLFGQFMLWKPRLQAGLAALAAMLVKLF